MSAEPNQARQDAANEVKLQLIQSILDQPYSDAFALQEIRRVLAHKVESKPGERAEWADTGSGAGYTLADDTAAAAIVQGGTGTGTAVPVPGRDGLPVLGRPSRYRFRSGTADLAPSSSPTEAVPHLEENPS